MCLAYLADLSLGARGSNCQDAGIDTLGSRNVRKREAQESAFALSVAAIARQGGWSCG